MINVDGFISGIKNAGILINGEDALRDMLLASANPSSKVLAVASMGRAVSMGFYKRHDFQDLPRLKKAFRQLGGFATDEYISMFMANVHPQLQPRLTPIPLAHEC